MNESPAAVVSMAFTFLDSNKLNLLFFQRYTPLEPYVTIKLMFLFFKFKSFSLIFYIGFFILKSSSNSVSFGIK